jgi:hypothetical protein
MSLAFATVVGNTCTSFLFRGNDGGCIYDLKKMDVSVKEIKYTNPKQPLLTILEN